MPRAENQKLKTLYIAKYFLEYSDENHAVSVNDICDYLNNECGITAKRRSIYSDMNVLRNEFGMDIDGKRGSKYYRLLSRQFEFDDLRLLAQCVYAAKFISAAQAKELINVLCDFCSIYQAEELQEEVFLFDRVKSNQKGTMQIISVINSAMAKRKDGKPHTPQKITFKYLTHSIKDVYIQTERKRLYKVSPYKLIINDGNYYLLAFDSEKQDMRTYRIDRMKDVKSINEPRDGEDIFAEMDINGYTRRVFAMYGGSKERVTMRFINPLLDTVIDRFGTGSDVFYMPDDKGHFKVIADVDVSSQFFAWICGFGKRAKIISPENIVFQMKEYITTIANMYKE